MRFKLVLLPLLVLAVLAGLVGCDLLGGASGTAVIGRLVIWYGTVSGGQGYHVVFYAPGVAMDPWNNYATAPQAASLEGTFPGGASDFYDTVNFQSTEVPPGLYSVFAWVDYDENGSFDPSQDLYGFYYGDPYPESLTQPSANVVVPEKGLVDLDVWVGYNAG
jgi:hypothetical protein